MGTGPIVHVDVDAFFAAVEQVLRPELRGRPVIVGGGVEGRGVVASASYEARAFGLHAGMPIHQARELCPGGLYLPPRHEEYNRFAERVFDVLAEFSPSVEQTSLDEASVSLEGCERLYADWADRPIGRLPFVRVADGVYGRCEAGPTEPAGRVLLPERLRWAGAVAARMKRLVRARTGLTVSAGLGPNRLVAKVAAGFAKPDGLTAVEPGREGDFVAMLRPAELPGVGRAVREKFAKWNVRTVPDARRIPLEFLEDAFGPERGRALYGLLRGQEAPSEHEEHAARREVPARIGRETTFWTASNDYEFVESMLFYLTERLGRALRRGGLQGRTVQVRLRYQDMATVQCSRALAEHTDRDDLIFEGARRLLAARWCRSRRVRLVGVGLTGLRRSDALQGHLFDDAAERSRRLDRCLDGLRERFGFHVVHRGPAINLLTAPGAPSPESLDQAVR